jgi:hypothetical protein
LEKRQPLQPEQNLSQNREDMILFAALVKFAIEKQQKSPNPFD